MQDEAYGQAKVTKKIEAVEVELKEVKEKLKKAEEELQEAKQDLKKNREKYENNTNAVTKDLKDSAQHFYDSLNQNLHDLNQKESDLRQLETELVKERAQTSVTSTADDKIKSLEESQKKMEEAFNNYIQKATTVQISNLSIGKIQTDGYRCIAEIIATPVSMDVQDPGPFQWLVSKKETDAQNTTAYLEYLNKFVKDYNYLDVRKSIEHPHLNTTVGVNPHHLKGKADLYIIPKAAGSIARNQLCAVIELKPGTILQEHLAQAIGYVIAADSLFEVDWRPSPIGILSNFMDHWTLIWVGDDNIIYYSEKEQNSQGNISPLSRGTAIFYLRKHLERYNRMLHDEFSKKRKAFDDCSWAFDGFAAGRLKKFRLEVEDNMRDLIEDEEELRLYDMRKRMENTPLFQIPQPAESHLPYFN
ncbi:hypothetical protein HDV03_002886 [Kappamyces sp. JEL0829]|nr:hypothetical protein HDV03_002886 [Kappamyces sp. JEL0829]